MVWLQTEKNKKLDKNEAEDGTIRERERERDREYKERIRTSFCERWMRIG